MNTSLNYLKVISVICLFICVGPTLIVLNKVILQSGQFPYPIFVSNLGMIVSALLARVAAALGFITPKKDKMIEGINWYLRVLPVGFAHAGTLMTGNWVYLYLDMGFIQMLKSFSPVMLLIISAILGIGKRATGQVVVGLLTISIGIFITTSAVHKDARFSWIGIWIMVFSMAFESFRLAMTQFFLQELKLNVLESMYTMAPASMIWLFTCSAIFELPHMMARDNIMHIMIEYIPMFLAAGGMGAVVNLVSYSLIQLTSSLTLKVITTIRNVGVVFIGIICFRESVTNYQFMGYSIALIGFMMYQASALGYNCGCNDPLPDRFCPCSSSNSSSSSSSSSNEDSKHLVASLSTNSLNSVGSSPSSTNTTNNTSRRRQNKVWGNSNGNVSDDDSPLLVSHNSEDSSNELEV